MENATNSKRVAPSTRRRSVSSSARTGPAGLVDYVVTDFLDACDSRDEASLSQLVRHAGTKAGELLEVLYRSQLALDGALDADAYARLITRVIQACGCSASSQITDSGLIRVVTQDCPYYLQDSQACNLVQSIIGTIGARNFDYAKVDLRHVGEVADKVCECRICLEPGRARQQPGLEYCDEYSSAQTHPATSNCLSSLSSTDSAGIGPQPLIVGRSRQMRRILGVLDTVAPTSATVLITGETGTGKECVARALHGLSERSDQEFIGVNCGTIPENLIESALFGHERGAFTSAHARHIGYFERANGSTLFLDEIDSLAPEAQVRLLRVLQEGLYERVGGRQILHSSARIVAATNAQLPTAIQDGRFRSDLYYRLNVVNMHIPPLRERPDDIPVLTELILARLNHRYRGCVTSLGRQAMRTLMDYHWPGNVRELENVLERSYLFASGAQLDAVELNAALPHAVDTKVNSQASPDTVCWKDAGKAAWLQHEKEAIESALARLNGNVSRVADALGYSRRAVYLKLRTHAIDPKVYRQ